MTSSCKFMHRLEVVKQRSSSSQKQLEHSLFNPKHVETIDLCCRELLVKNVKIKWHVLKCDKSIADLNGNKLSAVRIIHGPNVCKRSLPN